MIILTRPPGALVVGLILGLVFSVLNVISAYVAPLADEPRWLVGAFHRGFSWLDFTEAKAAPGSATPRLIGCRTGSSQSTLGSLWT